MAGGINLATKYSDKVDERFYRESQAMVALNNDYKFTGEKTVKVYSIPIVPMNDYDDLFLADPRLHRPEKLDPGALSPHAAARVIGSIRNRVIGFEPSKVIDPKDVINVGQERDPLRPPAVAVGSHAVPVEERIAP